MQRHREKLIHQPTQIMKLASLLVLSMATLTVTAQQRSFSEMQRIASERFGAGKSTARMANGRSEALFSSYSNDAFTVFEQETTTGFVIVSANEQMPEVLGYCDDARFRDVKSNNPSLKSLLRSYEKASELVTNGEATAEEIFGLSANIISTESSSTQKSPILGDINFAQGAPYNLKCPRYHDTLCVTGCGPTSMAMVLAHYKYPEHGNGSISYTTGKYKIPVSFDFEHTTFDWDHIKNTYQGYYEPKETKLQTYLDETKKTSALFFQDGKAKYGITKGSSNGNIYVHFIENDSEQTLTGFIQLIIYNPTTGVCRHASQPISVNGFLPERYYTRRIFSTSFPADIADGEYRLYLGYSTDSVNYVITTKEDGNEYYVPVTKSGKTFTCFGEKYIAASDYEEALPIATLMAACGAAAQANYRPNLTTTTGVTLWMPFNKYFGYDQDMYYIRSRIETSDNMAKYAKNELDKDHIVPVVANSAPTINPKTGKEKNGSGHAYLIDGYDFTGVNPMFHINWGWNGYSNSYFLLSNMRPSGAGTGGDTVNYSYSYFFCMNFIPDNGKDDGLTLSCPRIRVNGSAFNDVTAHPGDKLTIQVINLMNNSLCRTIQNPMALKFYLVSEDGTKHYVFGGRIPQKKAIEPADTQDFSYEPTLPNTIPAGKYHFEIRITDNDRFYCKNNPTIIVSQAQGIEDIQNDETEESQVKYDLFGRQLDGNSRGLIVKDGKKVFVTE